MFSIEYELDHQKKGRDTGHHLRGNYKQYLKEDMRAWMKPDDMVKFYGYIYGYDRLPVNGI